MPNRTLFFILIFFILPAGIGSAAFEALGLGAESLSLGNAVVAYSLSPYAVYYNPANITVWQPIQFGVGHRTFFSLPSPHQIHLLLNYPLGKIPFAACIIHLGDQHYQELQLLMGSSLCYQDKLRAGISLNLYHLAIKSYSSCTTAGLNIGFSYPLTEQFTMGVLITNLNQPKFRAMDEKLPQIFSVGWWYGPLENISFCLDLFRDAKYEQDYRAGIRINLRHELILRLGIEDKSNTYSLGVGFTIQKMTIDYAAMIHQILGISHITSIHFRL